MRATSFLILIASIQTATLVQAEEVTHWQDPAELPQVAATYPGACPKDEASFGAWVKQLTLGMQSPDEVHSRYNWIRLCQEKLPAAAKAPAMKCSSNWASFDQTFDDSKYGLNVAPEPAPGSVAPLSLPSALNDHDVLMAMKSGTDAELKQQMSKLSGQLPQTAKIVEFISGSSHRRTVTVFLPNEKEDIYFHYIGDSEYERAHPQGGTPRADVIRVHRLKADGSPTDAPQVDYFSVDNGGAPRAVADRCNSCHRSGSRAIVPEDLIFKSHTPNLSGSEIRDWFEDRRPELETKHGGVTYKNLGPYFGGDQATRTPEATLAFVKKCSESEIRSVSDEQAKKISKKMNCIGCHSSDGREDLLRFPMDIREFHLNTLDNLITHGHMPAGSDDPKSESFLKPEERRALLKCLKQDYFGGFKDDYWSQGNREPGTFMKFLTANCGPQETKPAHGVPHK